ncbi:RCC1/BLIP-II [Artomyces pyxidatus]|uniref:RCC1/BLIP-II n=1 Tax=Artomyces pyxidatus TaxID=48021 RepID=A0ACB8SKJ7_9AGAM|nr:RCC1/BLIP-II [Artomyces pyxidatus]
MAALRTSLYAAGSNGKGQLATGTLDDAHSLQPCNFSGSPPPSLPVGTISIDSLVGGGNHTVALLLREDRRKELWGCGDGSKGQLGPAYTADAGADTVFFRPVRFPLPGCRFEGFSVEKVAACWETTYLVVSKDGCSDAVISMGGDDFGDLGVGGLREKGMVRANAFHVVDFTSVVAGDARRIAVKDIAAGPHHVVVHLQVAYADGSMREHVTGWGACRHGQLGPLESPSRRPLAFVSAPHAIPFDAEDPITAIGAGNQHTVLLHSSGRVSGLGSNKKHQLSGLSDVSNARAIACTWNGTYVLAEYADAGTCLFSVGSAAKGQLGRPPEADHALAPVKFSSSSGLRHFACGSEHVLAVVSNQEGSEEPQYEVWGWGWNEHGNLATGSLEDVHTPIKVWPTSSAVHGHVDDIRAWAGCGSSWIAVRHREEVRGTRGLWLEFSTSQAACR